MTQNDNFPYLSIDTYFKFPKLENDSDGIVCSGGNLSPGMLLSAYKQGIFPWYNEDDPILWWSPDPRFVLFPNELHIPKRLERFMKHADEVFTYSMDTAFPSVIKNCAIAKRDGQKGTWIDEAIIEGYTEFFKLGYAHSFEVWKNSELAGGFYGVLVGSVFFGESMFTLVPDATKTAFIKFVQRFSNAGGKLIDSQVYTDNIARFGGRNISRSAFLKYEEKFLTQELNKISFFG